LGVIEARIQREIAWKVSL